MATEAWTVDGRALSAFAFDIMTVEGMDDMPDLEGDNTDFSNRHGQTWNAKYFGPAHKMLSMYVKNADPVTGVVPATYDLQRQNFDANLDTLTQMFWRPRRLLDIRRTLSNGTVRRALCETQAGFHPALLGTNSGQLTVDLILPFSFWEDVNNQTSANYNPNLGTQNITEFAAATAPMQELSYKITGPAASPKVIDIESGSYFQFQNLIPAGATLTVNSSDMTIATTGFSASIQDMVHIGDPRWITLNPSMDGALLDFSAGATTAATKLSVTGKRKYLR